MKKFYTLLAVIALGGCTYKHTITDAGLTNAFRKSDSSVVRYTKEGKECRKSGFFQDLKQL